MHIRVTTEEFVHQCNNHHANITFTTDCSNPLPALDLLLSINHHQYVAFEFYRKPVAINYMPLPWHSTHCFDTKRNYIRSEAFRIVSRCSQINMRAFHLGAFASRLRRADYPSALVTQQFDSAIQQWDVIQTQAEAGLRPLYRSRAYRRDTQPVQRHRGPPGPPVLWLPLMAPTMARRIQHAVRRSEVPIQVRFRAGIPLRSILCNNRLTPDSCPVGGGCVVCLSPGVPLGTCSRTDLVYTLECDHCLNSCYIGETRQQVGARIYQHLTWVRSGVPHTSATWMHHHSVHPHLAPSFSLRAVSRRGGDVLRRCLEQVMIDSERPDQNRLVPNRRPPRRRARR